jgi:uncharacterized protein YbaR (Trm112 family)
VNVMTSEALLDAILVDPETHEPMRRASPRELERLAERIGEGRARCAGRPLPARVEGAYVSHGGLWIYPDVEGIPSLLADERIVLEAALDID